MYLHHKSIVSYKKIVLHSNNYNCCNTTWVIVHIIVAYTSVQADLEISQTSCIRAPAALKPRDV